jgi:cytochrome c-type biogenesis protein CcmH/NrfG
VEQIRQFEGDVKLYRDKLIEIHRDVREAQSENNRIFQSYLIESENEGTEAWQKKVHLELLRQLGHQISVSSSGDSYCAFKFERRVKRHEIYFR